MSGSYSHCCEGDVDNVLGKFRFELIENMGDAHEACEEMHWLIQHLAKHNAKRIKKARKAYYKQVPQRGWCP